MAGNNALLPASTLLEWQEASINFLERKSDYALLVYHVTPHFGFEHRAIIRLAILGSDYSEFSRIGDPSSIQIPALRLPGKVHHETLRECMQMSLDAFGHIPLRIWIQFAFNVDEGILRQFLDYHMKLGTQLRTKELEVGEDFLAVSSTHPKYGSRTN